MKLTALLLFVTLFFPSAFGKIVEIEDKLYLRSEGKQVPLFLVNGLIEKKEVAKIKLFNKGKVRMLSFSKNREKEKLYSVDAKGFVYAIEPFASYEVSEIDEEGRITFREVPGRRYRINAKGFFLY